MPPTINHHHHSSNSNSSTASNSSHSNLNNHNHHSNANRFPIDLKMITDRLKSRYYCHAYLFRADVMRLFNNCRETYAPDSEQCKCATVLQTYFEKKMQECGLGFI